MFEQFLEQSKKKLEKSINSISSDIKKEYEKFWKELIEDLTRRKLGLEQEVARQEKTKEDNENKINSQSEQLLQLEETLKKKSENIRKYEIKENEVLDKITKIEEREQRSLDKKVQLEELEKNLETQRDKLSVDIQLFEERQNRFKRYNQGG